MAKIGGLAADLARQASEAALAEAREAESKTAPAVPSSKWTVPKLGDDFRLDEALHKALAAAADHMNGKLGPDGIVLNVPQGEALRAVELREKATDKLLKAYDGATFLTLHASREQRQGVVVDGQV